MTSTDPRADFLRFRREGDAAALARVFDALAPELLLLAAHLAPEHSGAEDLVQTTFLQAMRDARRYDGSRPLAAWLAGILAHRAADERRRARLRAGVQREGAAAEAADDALALLAEAEGAELVRGAIAALDEPYREVLVLRVVHGLAPTEIAHALGRTPGTVRMQLQRGRERLREALPRGLALPALFLTDDGRGLAAVREAVLAGARAPVAPAAAVSSAGLAKAFAGTLVVAASAFGVLVLRASARAPAAGAQEVVVAAPQSDRPALALAGDLAPFARIYALAPDAPGFLRPLGTADAAGTFKCPVVPPGTLVGARAAGFQPSGFGKRSATRVRFFGGVAEPLLLRLGADGHAFAGRVLLPDGTPAARASVAIAVDEDARGARAGMSVPRATRPPLDREAFVLACDADGRFATDEAPAGGALVIARPEDPALGLVACELLDIRTGAANERELVLRVGGEVRGRVTRTDGRPAAGLEVAAEWKGTDALGEMEDELGALAAGMRARTGSDGSYRLAGLLPGPHELAVRAGAKTLASTRFDLLEHAREIWDVVVEAQAPLTVRVVGHDGAPLAGWGLEWKTGDEARNWPVPRDQDLPVTLDADGRAWIEALDLRPHVLRVFAPGAGGRSSEVPCAERADVWPGTEELVVVLRSDEMPAGVVRGRWLDARGRPVAGASLELERDGERVAKARTNEDGAFVLERLPAGPLVLRSRAEKLYPSRAELAEIVLGPGETRDLGALALSDPVRLVVELVTEDGLPIARPEVELLRDEWMGDALQAERGTKLFRSSWIAPGEHVLLIRGADIACLRRTVRVAEQGETAVRIPCPRGREVVLDCVLLHEGVPESPEFDGGQIDVVVSQENARILWTRDAKPFHDPTRRVVRFPLRLAPGAYRALVTDHTWERENDLPRPFTELDLVVPASGAMEPVRVEIR